MHLFDTSSMETIQHNGSKVIEPNFGDLVNIRLELFRKLIKGSRIAPELEMDFAKMLRHTDKTLISGRSIGRSGHSRNSQLPI